MSGVGVWAVLFAGVGVGPLDAALVVEHLVVADAGDVAGLVAGDRFQGVKNVFGRLPVGEEVFAAPVVGDEAENGKIGEGLARCAGDFFDEAEAAFGVDEGAFFFAPTGGGEDEVGELGGFGRVVHVLNDEEVESVEDFEAGVLVDPGVGRVGANDPEAFDFSAEDAFDDFVVGPTVFLGDAVDVDVEDAGDFLAVGGVFKVVAA